MLHRLYYTLKPYVPSRVRLEVRRWNANRVRTRCGGYWPILESAGTRPEGWPGWPEGRRFAFVLSHDVEGPTGLKRCRALAELEMSLGFRSAFNFVPEGTYTVPAELIDWLKGNGFEVGVHDLHHDGKLFRSRRDFASHARRINGHLQRWGARGFRAGFMLHQLDWLHALNIDYDCSTFDVDPFEPQMDGTETIFPFWVPRPDPEADRHVAPEDPTGGQLPGGASAESPAESGDPHRAGYVELPYTLVQDLNLFVVLGEKTTEIWERKLEWIAARGGMALLNTHPDCMVFDRGARLEANEYPVALYEGFLRQVKQRYGESACYALPGRIAAHARTFKSAHVRQRRQVGMVVYNTYDNDNRVRRYAESLARRGDVVRVLALAGPKQEVGRGELNGVRVERLFRPNREDRSRWAYLWNYWRFGWKCFRTLQPRRFPEGCDVVHVHNMPEALVFAVAMLKWRGTRIILDLHDLMPELYQDKFHLPVNHPIPRLLRMVERWSCRFSDHVIVSNHLWKGTVAGRLGSDADLTALINHVDLHHFGAHTKTRREDGRFVIVYPGSLNRHQGLDLAIEAVSRVRKQLSGVELHIYGTGPERENLKAQAAKLGLDGAVVFRDPVPFSGIGAVMAQADLGVVPKRADGFGNEAFSTKIMEFMSVGLPVVVSRTKIDSYYFSEECVCFFEPGNAADLAAKILELAGDPQRRERQAAKARELVRRTSWEAMEKVYLDLVDRLTRTRVPVLRAAEAGN